MKFLSTTLGFLLSASSLLSAVQAQDNCSRDVYFSIDVDASVFGTNWTLRNKKTDEIELVGDNTKPKDPFPIAGLAGPNITPGVGKFLCPGQCYRLVVSNTQENKCPFKYYVDGVFVERGGKNKCDVDIDICVDYGDTPPPSPWDLNRGDGNRDDPRLSKPEGLFPSEKLLDCEGSCQANNDKCKGDLVCYERDSNSPKGVPGCRGLAEGSTDYCIDATKDSNKLEFMGSAYGKPDYAPYGRCRGDCDDDNDCDTGLECFERDSGNTRVPGCEGTPERAVDYCIDPRDRRTRPPTRSPTSSPTFFPTFNPTRRPRRRPTPRPTPAPQKTDCFVEIQLLTDKYPTETSWVVEDRRNNNKMVFAGNGFNEQYRNYNSGQRLPVGRYRFRLGDKAKDGMIGGEWKVLVDGKDVGSGGGDFTDEVSVDFRCDGNVDNSNIAAGKNNCEYRGQISRNGEWVQGPTHKCKCVSGSWAQCSRNK